jgi:hypothetical protein
MIEAGRSRRDGPPSAAEVVSERVAVRGPSRGDSEGGCGARGGAAVIGRRV